MQTLFILWQELYANYLERVIDDGDPTVLSFAEWFAVRRHILEHPRRREYVWLVAESDLECETA